MDQFDEFAQEQYEDDYQSFEDRLAIEDADADMADMNDDPYAGLEDTFGDPSVFDDDPYASEEFEEWQCRDFMDC